MDSIWKRKCNNLAHNLDSVESFFARLLRNQKDSRKEREKLEFKDHPSKRNETIFLSLKLAHENSHENETIKKKKQNSTPKN